VQKSGHFLLIWAPDKSKLIWVFCALIWVIEKKNPSTRCNLVVMSYYYRETAAHIRNHSDNDSYDKGLLETDTAIDHNRMRGSTIIAGVVAVVAAATIVPFADAFEATCTVQGRPNSCKVRDGTSRHTYKIVANIIMLTLLSNSRPREYWRLGVPQPLDLDKMTARVSTRPWLKKNSNQLLVWLIPLSLARYSRRTPEKLTVPC
jgi:hypothetical protein